MMIEIIFNAFFLLFQHLSFVLAGHVARYLAGLRLDDVLYNALPLYHSSAGMLALAPCYLYGLTVVLKPKFSVSSFWKDCVKYKATVSLGHTNMLNSGVGFLW